MNKILIPNGPGFSDAEDLSNLVREVGWSAEVASFTEQPVSVDWEAIRSVGGAVFRGTWTAIPEEKLHASLLALRFASVLKIAAERLKDPKDPFRLLAIGRGALMIFQSGDVFSESQPRPLDTEWKRALESSPPWISLDTYGPLAKSVAFPNQPEPEGVKQVLKKNEKYRPLGLVKGRVFPDFPTPNPWGLEVVIRGPGEIPLGWSAFNGKLFLCLVDPLSYSDRMQLEGYGYEDLLKIPPRSLFLGKIFGSGDSDIARK